jgi:uncharacterized integral membrane protein (TIGR00698 family)
MQGMSRSVLSKFRQGFSVWPLLPGLALSVAVAACALLLAARPWAQAMGLSPLTLAIVLGMAVGHTVYPRLAAPCAAGVTFSRQQLLRTGVVLYGLRLTLQDVAQVGWTGVATDALVLGSTFTLAYFAGTRWLGLDRCTAILIGAGSSICGAAAVLATEPVARARAEQVIVAVATVVVFGTLAIFIYPWLFQWNAVHAWIPGGTQGFGIYIGSTVHEVAQVVAAGQAIGADAADTAVITKMVRVMMLAPFLLLLATWLARQDARDAARDLPGAAPRRGARMPLFPLAFVAMVALHSTGLIPSPLQALGVELGTALLAVAMAALGMATHVSAFVQAGPRPLVLGALLFGWLIVGGGFINRLLGGA